MFVDLQKRKKFRKLKTMVLILIIISMTFFIFNSYFSYESYINASYSPSIFTKRNIPLNVYDTIKGTLVYKKISKTFDQYPKDSVEKLQAMVTWVYKNIRPHTESPGIVINDNFYNVLRRGMGSCDQCAQAFDFIACMQGYKVHSLALYDSKEGISPHTINEIFWDGKWVVVDPWKNVVFQNNGDLMTKENIANDDSILRRYEYPKNIIADDFRNTFYLEPFPLISFDNIIKKFKQNKEKINANVITNSPQNPNSKLGKTENLKTLDRDLKRLLHDYNLAREADISGDYKKAYSLYCNIKNANLLKDLEETIEYQKAIALYNSGDNTNADKLLRVFLDKYKDSQWKPSVLYYLDMAKENVINFVYE